MMSQGFIQEKQKVKDQQSWIFVFVAYLTFQLATRGTNTDMTTVFNT